MSNGLTFDLLSDGCVARYIKPSHIVNGIINAAAFDLRDGPPPESYVSFFKVEGESVHSKFLCGYKIVGSRFRGGLKSSSAIALLEVKECLEQVNDEEQDLIEFKDQDLPHCGLYYLTNNLVKIQEIKTTLGFLAQDNLESISKIKSKMVQIETK